jgi:hypothetical protein
MTVVPEVAEGSFTEVVLGDFAPWTNYDVTGDHQVYVQAVASMFEEAYGLIKDTGSEDDPSSYVPAWSKLLDPDTCPDQFLPFLAQFNGTVVPPGTDGDQARAIIRGESGFQRGTAAAIINAAARTLIGTQTVNLFERQAADGTPDAYHMVIMVSPLELVDETALVQAVNNIKPAGIQWTLVIAAWTIGEMEGYADTIAHLEGDFSNVKRLELKQPG